MPARGGPWTQWPLGRRSLSVIQHPIERSSVPNHNPLAEMFYAHKGRRVNKWVHYLDIYHRHLERFRGQPVTVVEFGVMHGGSLQLWREYFGPSARIVGVDINPECQKFEDADTRIFIGDQADRDFLMRVSEEVGPVDVLIEDGGHFPHQQLATFEVFYPRMTQDGCFIIEDLHTSYWPSHSGGLRRKGTFMQFAKQKVDQLNAWHSREEAFKVSRFTRSTRSVHFYDSVVVFERGRVRRPKKHQVGEPTLSAPPR
jgi:cephalosporin hydroxylase